MHRSRLRSRFGGSGGGIVPLTYATPSNYWPDIAPTAATALETNVRLRIAFRIGSANMSELAIAFGGCYSSGSVQNMPNAYSVVKLAIEKSGQTFSVPVTFSGLRTLTVNAGDAVVESDAVLPASFGLAEFTRGDLYYMRLEYAVAVGVTDLLPRGPLPYTKFDGGFPANVGLRINPATFVGSAVDSYGTLAFTSGYSNFANPYTPIVLGRPIGPAKAVILIGDSIVGGQIDTTVTKGLMGFSRALADADGTSNPVGGINMGISGSVATAWNSTKLQAYLPYATAAIEEFGTNNWLTSPGTTPATSLTQVQAIWDLCTAAGVTPYRVKMIPRTTGNATTPLNAAWASGGNARAFNSLLDTAGVTLITRNSLRVGSTEGTDEFYQWTGGATNTGDYTHPNTAGAIVDAVDLRAGIAAM